MVYSYNIEENPNYIQEAAVFLNYDTHGGEDVPIYSSGPMSFLFTGTVEQSYIAHAMAYSACIGAYNTEECRNNRGSYESATETATTVKPSCFGNIGSSIKSNRLISILMAVILWKLIF